MNTYYKLYITSILRLAATLVIKSEYTAKALNTRLSLEGYAVNPDNPRTWKYYLNLAGLAHEKDVPMQVVSLDTLEIIDFTRANLLIHRATRREYVYGTPYYNALIAKFPDQTALINGIINPIDMDTALSAADHNILFYDQSLVEPAEQQLIPKLQEYIDRFFARFDNSDMALFDPMYHPGLLMTLYSKLHMEIINIRKAACLTDNAHTYHIRQYLLSFSPIGKEFDFMTQKQRLFFYRNIRYLNLNIGRQEILDLMTQKVLTDRGFSLAAYDFGHVYENMATTLTPMVVANRITVNGIDPAQGSNQKTVGELLDLELPLARDNLLVRDDTEISATIAMEKSFSNKLKTKVLESNVVDRTDAEPFTLTEVLLNHWIYLSHYDKYKSVVNFVNPANGDAYAMSVKDAFIFYLYAYNRSIDATLTTVPVLSANRVRRWPLPTKEELRSLCTKDKVPDYYLDYILDTQVNLQTYVSIETFREACQDIHHVMLAHREMRHYNGDYIAEGQLHSVIDRCYQDIRIDLAGGVDYDLWLNDHGIDVTTMGRLEFELMAHAIFLAATGGDLGTTSSMRAIHASMIRIMRELSSYSVQFIAQINDSPIKIIDGKFPKLTIPVEDYHTYTWIENPWPQILDVKTYRHTSMEVKVYHPNVKPHVTSQAIRQKVPVDVGIELVSTTTVEPKIELSQPLIRLLQPASVDITNFPYTGTAGYLAIPPQNLSDLVNGTDLSGYNLLTEARRQRMLSI